MAGVLKAIINPQFNRGGHLKGVTGFKKQLDYTHANIGAKVKPHEPSVLIVYPTQILK